MRKHIIYRYFLFLSLVGLMQLTFSCSSSSNEIEPLKPEGEDTPLEKDEYTFLNVEYRKWQNGTFQAWTTADSRETRTIDNMNWYTPSSDYSRTAWGGRIGLQPSSVVGKESFYQRIPIAVWSAGIAAMMVIALGLGLIFYSENQAGGSGEWSCYEGSYVEVGGKRISDVKQIMPCIIETLEEAERVEKLAQERVEEICRSEKEIEEKELLVSE